MRVPSIINNITASKRSAIVYSIGTAFSQLIVVLGSLLLARLYVPAEFGVFALFTAISALFSAIIGCRYETAIVIPKTIEEARAIVLLSSILGIVGCAIVFALLIVANLLLDDIFGPEATTIAIFLLPINCWLIHILIVLNHWMNRHRLYPKMARLAIFQAIAINSVSILLGLYSYGASGLILGAVLGRILSLIVTILYGVKVTEFIAIAQTNKSLTLSLARQFQNHPKHLLPAQMIGSLGRQLSVVTLSVGFDPSVVGYYSMAQRFVSLPTTTLALAIGEVYRERVGSYVRNSRNFRGIFLKTLLALAVVAVIFTTIFYIYSPRIFELLLGPEWSGSAEYVRVLLIAAFFQFVFVPIDKGAVIKGRTKFLFAWQISRLIFAVIVFAIVYFSSIDAISALWLIVISSSLLYVANGIANYRFSK